MKTLRYEFILEAEQPIAHHSESIGNKAIAMQRRVRLPDGDFADVPIVSADTMRHGMREAVAYAYLDAAGLLTDAALSESALRLLFAGGMITGKGDAGAVKLDAYRQLVDLVPSVALFGGCAGNRCIPGRLFVEDGMLVCEEQRRYLPEWATAWLTAQGQAIDTCRAHIEEAQRVRMDPALDPGKRRLLAAGAEKVIEARLDAGEKAAAEGDAVGRADSKSTMMPRQFERVVQGSLFFWRVSAHTYSALDEDTLTTALATFLYSPVVGGKKGTGHGKLRCLAARNMDVRRPAERAEEVDVRTLGSAAGSLFRTHVSERKSQIKKLLDEIDA